MVEQGHEISLTRKLFGGCRAGAAHPTLALLQGWGALSSTGEACEQTAIGETWGMRVHR